ncbi:MAG: DUF4150 domain-containing protein [Nitrospirae bacterium]|jgi:hypothetical protein|nr:DUF4150 domain-containing protein [Nitrospirota bacterium]
MFANTQMGGMALGFPDVCKTPAGPVVVPVPYPNIAMGPMAVPPIPNILFGGAPAQNLMAEIPLTQGDDAGVLGGVLSSTEMGTSRCLDGASTVLLGGAPATRLTSTTLQNGVNAPGVCLVPSQVTVLLLAP